MRLAGSLHWFWNLHGHFSDGRRWLEAALAQTSEEERTPERAKVLVGAGLLAARQADYPLERMLTVVGSAAGYAVRSLPGGTVLFCRADATSVLVATVT